MVSTALIDVLAQPPLLFSADTHLRSSDVIDCCVCTHNQSPGARPKAIGGASFVNRRSRRQRQWRCQRHWGGRQRVGRSGFGAPHVHPRFPGANQIHMEYNAPVPRSIYRCLTTAVVLLGEYLLFCGWPAICEKHPLLLFRFLAIGGGGGVTLFLIIFAPVPM